MNADYVENIIRNIDKQSYKCILVDGAWGIGKSYADIVVTSFAYHFTQKMHDDYPDAASLMSRGHAYDLKSSATVSKHFAIFGEIEKSPVIIRSSAIYCSDLMTIVS